MLLLGKAVLVLLNWKLNTWPLQLSHASELIGKKTITGLVRVIEPDSRVEIGLLLHSEGEEENVWNAGDHLECLLVLPPPMIKVNRIWKQSNTGRPVNGNDSSQHTSQGTTTRWDDCRGQMEYEVDDRRKLWMPAMTSWPVNRMKTVVFMNILYLNVCVCVVNSFLPLSPVLLYLRCVNPS